MHTLHLSLTRSLLTTLEIFQLKYWTEDFFQIRGLWSLYIFYQRTGDTGFPDERQWAAKHSCTGIIVLFSEGGRLIGGLSQRLLSDNHAHFNYLAWPKLCTYDCVLLMVTKYEGTERDLSQSACRLPDSVITHTEITVGKQRYHEIFRDVKRQIVRYEVCICVYWYTCLRLAVNPSRERPIKFESPRKIWFSQTISLTLLKLYI